MLSRQQQRGLIARRPIVWLREQRRQYDIGDTAGGQQPARSSVVAEVSTAAQLLGEYHQPPTHPPTHPASAGWVALAGWLGGWLGGWVGGRVAGWVAGSAGGDWVGGWVGGVGGWLGGWVGGWLAGWLASCRTRPVMGGWVGGWLAGWSPQTGGEGAKEEERGRGEEGAGMPPRARAADEAPPVQCRATRSSR